MTTELVEVVEQSMEQQTKGRQCRTKSTDEPWIDTDLPVREEAIVIAAERVEL